MADQCPIDHTKLTMFNEYELKDGSICYDCADKIGLVKHDSHQLTLLAKAAKSVLTVNDAEKLVKANQLVDYEKLEVNYKAELNDSSRYIDSTQKNVSDGDVDAANQSFSEKSKLEVDKSNAVPSTPTKETIKATPNPRFWKGDGVAGFVYGGALGFAVGIINILFLHIWHIGIIAWIVTWLVVGTNPHFKDKRTPEQKKADAEKANKARQNRQNKKTSKTDSATVTVNHTTIIENPQKKVSRKAPHCPKCKSNNIQILDNKRRFSIGKTVAGALVFNGVGATVGAFAGKRGKKYHAVCMDCGKKFMIKL